MIYHEKPEDFKPEFVVVSCFVEADGEILLLLRQDHKPQGNTWGVPAGKIEQNENLRSALSREIIEETGLKTSSTELKFHSTVYVRYPEYDFEYHIFHLALPQKFEVKINPEEHKGYQWVKPEQSLYMPLIADLGWCIQLFYRV